MGGDRPRDVLPIELLNSFDLLANARVEYVDAIVDYNRASSRCTWPWASRRRTRWPIPSRSRESCRAMFPPRGARLARNAYRPSARGLPVRA